jgi:UDP-glucose 4-epimerase
VAVGRADWHELPELLASGIDAVLHAAWDLKTPITRSPEAVIDANLMTTLRLLEACRAQGVAKFALMSTGAVYGEGSNTAEDAACCPVMINGITKLLNERIVEAFCAESGIECQIYRVFNMYGGTDRFSILSHLRRALDQDTLFTLNNEGGAQRDFIHVSDVARIVMTLLSMTLPEVYMNVGTGRATRISEIVAVVQRLHPELRITRSSVREAEYSRADISRLSSTLGELRFIDVMDFVEREFNPDWSAGLPKGTNQVS